MQETYSQHGQFDGGRNIEGWLFMENTFTEQAPEVREPDECEVVFQAGAPQGEPPSGPPAQPPSPDPQDPASQPDPDDEPGGDGDDGGEGGDDGGGDDSD